MGLCILGSSLNFSALGGRGKEKNQKSAEKIAVGSEGEADRRSNQKADSHAALLVQNRTQQKSFPFLLPARRSLGAGGVEKIGRAQIKKCRENFFAGWRASANGGGAERQFRSKKVLTSS